MFGLEYRFGSAFVSIHQIPSKRSTFNGIIINFSLENGLGFHLDLDLDLLKIVHGLGFEILNGFGYMDLDLKLF